jgi:Pyridoxamine 5'-phosphate oxidase
MALMRWDAFATACPELAERARVRLEEGHLCLVGTLRRDGGPRISPVEPYIVAGELMIGMMWLSRKAHDLLRDPRIVVHSTVSDWEATEGDVKLYGRAEHVPLGSRRNALYRAIERAHGWPVDTSDDDDPEYHVFAVDIETAGYVRFAETTWESWSWSPNAGLRRQERPK